MVKNIGSLWIWWLQHVTKSWDYKLMEKQVVVKKKQLEELDWLTTDQYY